MCSQRHCSTRGSGTTPWVKARTLQCGHLLCTTKYISFQKRASELQDTCMFSKEFCSLIQQVHTVPWHGLGVFLAPGHRVKTKTPASGSTRSVCFYYIFCQFCHSLLHTTASHRLEKGESELGLRQLLSLPPRRTGPLGLKRSTDWSGLEG